jgi:hypothetical protein
MFKRLAFFFAIAVTIGLVSQAAADPADVIKNRAKHIPQIAKRDTDNVVGAIWRVQAQNTTTGEKREVRFRAKDGVLYDATNKVIGELKATKKPTITKVTLADGLAISGTFTAEMVKDGNWTAVVKNDAGEWNLKLTKIDK